MSSKGTSLSRSHQKNPSNLFQAIREYDAKLLLAYWLERAPSIHKSAQIATKFIYPTPKVAQVSWDPSTGTITPDSRLPSWVFTEKLVAKPDQLIKRRGKAGLLALNKTWEDAKAWIAQRAGKPQKARVSLKLTSFCCSPDICVIGSVVNKNPINIRLIVSLY
jgi:ATP citrate (pro-S)-lyase